MAPADHAPEPSLAEQAAEAVATAPPLTATQRAVIAHAFASGQ